MASSTRYTVPCPSCEAEVLIKSADLIGKKTECAKCKYRFTVPEPTDADGEDSSKAKTTKKGKKEKKKAKGGNGMLVGIVLGVLALGGLATAGYFLFGEGDSGGTSTPVARNTGGSGSGASAAAATTPDNTATTGGDGSEKAATGGKITSGGKPEDGTETPSTSDGGATKPAEKPAAATDQKDVTNLLPNDTRAVYRVNMTRVRQSATPLYTSFFDNYVQGLFQSSFSVPFEDVQTYIHCVVDPDREPFGVIRTSAAIDKARLFQAVEMERPASMGSAKREYFLLKRNPFVDAVSKAFTLKAVLGLAGLGNIASRLPDPPAPDPKAKPKRYALCVYDSTTLMVGSEAVIERYLTVDLQDNGYPNFKSELTPAEPPPPAADPSATPPGGGPLGGEAKPVAGPGSANPGSISLDDRVQLGRGGRGQQPPPGGATARGEGDVPGAAGGGDQPRAARRKLYTSVATYRTVEPALKRLLNQLEEDEKNPPAVIYAEMIDQRLLGARQAGEYFRATADPLAGLASRVQLIGGVLSQFDKDKGAGRLALEFVSDDEARRAINENVRPLLTLIRALTDITMNMQTSIDGVGGGGGGAGGPGGLVPGGDGSADPSGGGGSRGGDDESRRRGMGSRQRPGGGAGGLPEEGGGGDAPGTDPGASGGPTGTFLDDGKGNVNILQTDRVVMVSADLNWPETKFSEVLMPRITRTGGQIRGRLAVQSGEADWHSLAATATKLGRDKKPFPRGTVDREIKEERYRLPFPPEQRVSFLADLLPYLGRAGLRQSIQDKKPWWGKENIGIAETWVPEFLVPYYPQESWRAEHPQAAGRQLGGTNYVAPAGIGLDSARYDPANPAHAKKVGITGYAWGSKPEEVTDGLSSTIYLLQSSPDYKQAWVAGGGSTVRGIDEVDPLRGYAHRAPDGRRGAYALMADGSVRWLPQGTNPDVVKGLVTRAGGEQLGDLDKLAPVDKPKRKESELKGGGGLPTAKAAAVVKKVDEAELKKLQGKWKATAAFVAGKKLSAEDLAKLNLTVTFEGTITKNVSAIGVETAEVVRLDPSTKPARVDVKDSKSGKIDFGVYVFDGPDKLKVRTAGDEATLPKSLELPADGAKSNYFELERVKE